MSRTLNEIIETVYTEENSVIRLFKLIDMYEYLFKLLTVSKLQELVSDSKSIDLRDKNYKNLCELLVVNFQRPSFGHWIHLLRSIYKLKNQKNTSLQSILQNSDKVIVIRNRFAHGITPTDEVSNEKYQELKEVLDEIFLYINEGDIYNNVHEWIELTPLLNNIHEVFNGIRKDKLEFLNYIHGHINEETLIEDFNTFYEKYFHIKLHVSEDEVLLLLNDYFSREHWEEELYKKATQFQYLFIYGHAGVGKTMLAARLSQMINCSMYRFTSSNKKSLTATKSFSELYKTMRKYISGLPNIPNGLSAEDLQYYIKLLAEQSLETKTKHFYIFDGLDELSNLEFDSFCEYVTIMNKSNIHLIMSARNRSYSTSISEIIPNLQILELLPMTPLEVKSWIKQHSNSIQFPSIKLVEELFHFSDGNFLFLSNIPANEDESRYFEIIKNIPDSVENIFENMVEKLGQDKEVLFFLLLMPGTTSRKLLSLYFSLNDQSYFELKKRILPAIKETENESMMLFHDKFHVFLKTYYPEQIKKLSIDILKQIHTIENEIKPFSAIPGMFMEYDDHEGLLFWSSYHINAIDRETSMFYNDRYEYIQAMIKCFNFLLSKDLEFYDRTLPLLEIFISNNFQLLMDWKVCSIISKQLDKFSDLFSLEPYEHIQLMYGCNLLIEEKYQDCLDYLLLINKNIIKGSINKLRCLDYIGLAYNSLGQVDIAIKTYSEVIKLSKEDPTNVWIGYAKMNRGKIYLKQGNNSLAIDDLTEATEIRKNIAYDNEVFIKSIVDIGNKTQARLTLAMGYENIFQYYFYNVKDDVMAKKYALRLETLIVDTFKEDIKETSTFMFTSRMLMTLLEYYQVMKNSCAVVRIYEYLKDSYIPSTQMKRYRLILAYISSAKENENNQKNDLESIFKVLHDIKLKRDQSEESEDEELYEELTEGAQSIKEKILEDESMLNDMLQRCGVSKLIFKKKDILDIIKF